MKIVFLIKKILKLFIRIKRCKRCGLSPIIKKLDIEDRFDGINFYISCGEYHSPGVRLCHYSYFSKTYKEAIKNWNRNN